MTTMTYRQIPKRYKKIIADEFKCYDYLNIKYVFKYTYYVDKKHALIRIIARGHELQLIESLTIQ